MRYQLRYWTEEDDTLVLSCDSYSSLNGNGGRARGHGFTLSNGGGAGVMRSIASP